MKKVFIGITAVIFAVAGMSIYEIASNPSMDQQTRDTMVEFADAEMIGICEIDDITVTVYHKEGKYAYMLNKTILFKKGTLARPVSSKEFALNICKGCQCSTSH